VARDIATARQWIDRSRIHWDQGDVDRALQCCRAALEADPDNVDALANTGTLLWVGGGIADAERLWLKAHALDPSHQGVLLNLAALRNDLGDLEASLAWIDKAARLRPGNPDVVWRRSLVELAMGDYANGWKHYEAGLDSTAMRGVGPGFGTPAWAGEPCNRLVLWHEQGFGDTLQFVRYAKLCKERAANVRVLCPPPLTAILKSCCYVDDAVSFVDEGTFDQHISLMSLPHVFGTTVQTIPAPIPYLFADPALAAQWAARMRGDKVKVGLVWAANVRKAQLRFSGIDGRRCVPLAALLPPLAGPGVAFYSLQKGDAASEAKGTDVRDFMDEIADFAGTAAVVENLDLVISVDTSVAHLAGALGKPVWILSRYDACWRWLRNRPDTPWYPRARVFGQLRPGDWESVIAAVGKALQEFEGARASGTSC
jgi:hypothetical protein